jgi:hypothetical protein
MISQQVIAAFSPKYAPGHSVHPLGLHLRVHHPLYLRWVVRANKARGVRRVASADRHVGLCKKRCYFHACMHIYVIYMYNMSKPVSNYP